MGQMEIEIQMQSQRLPQVSLSNKTYVSVSDVLLPALGFTFETQVFYYLFDRFKQGILSSVCSLFIHRC